MSDIPYGRTAVVTIDLHRGHLDPDVATMPLPAEVAALERDHPNLKVLPVEADSVDQTIAFWGGAAI